jgi:hypothetical protein
MQRFTRFRRRRWAAPLATATLLLLLGSCTGDDQGRPGNGSGQVQAGPVATESLRGICPDRIVVQTDWLPGPEYGALYRLVGAGGTVEGGVYRGQLGETGVQLEIRPGGTAIAFEPIPTVMYTDTSIFLGVVDTTDAVESSRDLPTVGVVAPLDKSPLVLLWDPAQFDFAGLADIGRSEAKVVHPQGATYIDVLVDKKLLGRQQLDAGYDGTPQEFTTEQGIVQQGTVGTEPYVYEHELAEWRKPVKFALVDESGFRPYRALSVRAETLETEADCLAKLVPMIQRAQLDYIRDPSPVNAKLPEIAREFAEYWTVTKASADDGARKLRELQVVGDGHNGTLGDFDTARVDRVITEVVAAQAENEVQSVKPGVKSSDLITNRFVDATISIGSK